MYDRIVENKIDLTLTAREILILYGPRRVGKTTLLKKYQNKLSKETKTAYYSLDDPTSVAIFSDFSGEKLRTIFEGLGFSKESRNYLFLDEVATFSNVDLLLKLIYDEFPEVKVLASSSSSLLMVQNLTESLAGRKFFIEVLPLSIAEIEGVKIENYFAFKENSLLWAKSEGLIEQIALFGSYPEVINAAETEFKRGKLRDLVDSALFKDIFVLEGIKNPRVLTKLVSLLAHQIGQLVNLNEIATTLGVSRRLTEEYLGYLEKFFVVYRLVPFGRNLRSEIGAKFKVYFWDLGIRNALIGRFEPILTRDDRGAILENLVVTGVARRNYYEGQKYQLYFWRTYSGAEVDLVLLDQETGKISAIETKFSGKGKISSGFKKYSPERSLVVSFRDSYRFLL